MSKSTVSYLTTNGISSTFGNVDEKEIVLRDFFVVAGLVLLNVAPNPVGFPSIGKPGLKRGSGDLRALQKPRWRVGDHDPSIGKTR